MTTLTTTTENIDTLTPFDRLVVRETAKAQHSSLDAAEQWLRAQFSNWFVYRGGNHVALHRADGGARVLFIAERTVNQTLDFAAAKDAVATERRRSQREAKAVGRKFNCGFVRSRGTFLSSGTPENMQTAPFIGAEAHIWDGTKRSLLDAVALITASHPNVEVLDIEGGFDIADRIDFEDYEPHASTWAVTVWTRATGWQF